MIRQPGTVDEQHPSRNGVANEAFSTTLGVTFNLDFLKPRCLGISRLVETFSTNDVPAKGNQKKTSCALVRVKSAGANFQRSDFERSFLGVPIKSPTGCDLERFSPQVWNSTSEDMNLQLPGLPGFDDLPEVPRLDGWMVMERFLLQWWNRKYVSQKKLPGETRIK